MNEKEQSLFLGECEKDCRELFEKLDDTEAVNTRRILKAFQEENVAVRHFAPSEGYGYDDIGRDTLERIFARLFGAQDAIVRPHIVSGTHALSLALFGLTRPGDQILSVTGVPYDTLQTVIGISGSAPGSLKERGVGYIQTDLLPDGGIDVEAACAAATPSTRLITIQRSRGYAWRSALMPDQMRHAIRCLHERIPGAMILVDNCYGEFTSTEEPTHWGADVCAGSLIKNPGGGIAPTGGYLCGTKKAIEQIENSLTAPGIGREEGSYAGSYRPFYQGLFMAPHAVTQALKTSILAARVFEKLGYLTSPAYDGDRGDIIQAIQLKSPGRLIAFCRGIQSASPVDSNALPEPWDMPGYQDQVIMAAGTFVPGASIELSADGPMREPYTVYLQGALTYQHGKEALRQVLSMLESAVD